MLERLEDGEDAYLDLYRVTALQDQANIIKSLRSARADLAAVDRAIARRENQRKMLERLAVIRHRLIMEEAFANLIRDWDNQYQWFYE